MKMEEIEGFSNGDEVSVVLEIDGRISDPIKGMLIYANTTWTNGSYCWFLFHNGTDSWTDSDTIEIFDNDMIDIVENRGYTKGWRLNDSVGGSTWYVIGSIKEVSIKGRKYIPKFDFVN